MCRAFIYANANCNLYDALKIRQWFAQFRNSMFRPRNNTTPPWIYAQTGFRCELINSVKIPKTLFSFRLNANALDSQSRKQAPWVNELNEKTVSLLLAKPILFHSFAVASHKTTVQTRMHPTHLVIMIFLKLIFLRSYL